MAATVAVVAGALIVIIGRPQSFSDPLGTAIAQLSSGKAGASLIQERQQVILSDAATQSFSVTSAPKLSIPAPPPAKTAAPPAAPPPNPSSAQGIAYNMLASFGFSTSQWSCLDALWQRESGWRYNAENPSGAYGIPQALPGSKMATAGADWQTNPATQIKWGLGYIQGRYGTPCSAWSFEEANGFY
ncbi:MAG TPA: transglycosylase SLT domain-containing protein [Streptosporangiaceae bacterium]